MIGCHGIGKSFVTPKGTFSVIANLSFEVRAEEFLTIFGPNGCGKSTLMNVFAGIEQVDSGDISGLDQLKGKIGFVFQDYRRSLLPWATVRENICFPLKLQGLSRQEQNHRIDDLVSEVDIDVGLNRSVLGLSGGQAQLVAILRALIVRPKLFILDEPFAALDYEKTQYLRSVVMKLALKFKLTTVLISHDIEDAILLGDRVLFLTRAPSHLHRELLVPFARPRDQQLTVDDKFIALKREALDAFSSSLRPLP